MKDRLSGPPAALLKADLHARFLTNEHLSRFP